MFPARQLPPRYVHAARRLFQENQIRLTDQFGLTSQLAEINVKPIPEYLFLGSTNVGKSSLLSALLRPPSRKPLSKPPKPADLPRTSQRKGFTRTLGAYTVGRSLRLVDSPGYGFKSSAVQGEVVAEYLNSRGDNLRQAYVLIHPKRGVSDQDEQVCSMLSSFGVPFVFVVTKYDEVSNLQPVKSTLEVQSELCRTLGVPAPDHIFATSAKPGHYFGIDDLRAEMYMISGLIEAETQK